MDESTGRSALYVGCVYMPTDSTSIAAVDAGYVRLKEDVLTFRQKGKVVLLGDFNAKVGRSVEVDDVIGMFGEDACNASGGNRLISFLNEEESVVCKGRKLVVEPEWTRVRPSLKQKSKIITDPPLMAVSRNVHVDNTDIGCSDHFLAWMELGRTAKNFKKETREIRRWRLERFEEDEVKLALKAEVHGFSESVKSKLEGGMKGHDLVLMEWESIVKREVGDKIIVCGRAARWWDNEIIHLRRKLYNKLINGREDL